MKGWTIAALLLGAAAVLIWWIFFRHRKSDPVNFELKPIGVDPARMTSAFAGAQRAQKLADVAPMQMGVVVRGAYWILVDPEHDERGVRLMSLTPDFHARYARARAEWERVQIELQRLPTALRPRKKSTKRDEPVSGIAPLPDDIVTGSDIDLSKSLRRNDEPDVEQSLGIPEEAIIRGAPNELELINARSSYLASLHSRDPEILAEWRRLEDRRSALEDIANRAEDVPSMSLADAVDDEDPSMLGYTQRGAPSNAEGAE